MNSLDNIHALIERIESGTRVEGDADCAFHGGHWHGQPVEGGTVAVISGEELIAVPTAEFVADGRILWDLSENGEVLPKGTLEQRAKEAAASEVTPEPPHPDAVEVHPDATPEPAPEEQPQPVAQEVPETSTEAPAAEPEPVVEAPAEVAPETPAVVEEPAPVAEPAVPEVTPEPPAEVPAEPVAEAPAEEPAPEAPAAEEAPADPVVTRKRKTTT